MSHCPYFGRCGGCTLQDHAPEEQLALKQAHLLQTFHQAGGLEPATLLAPLQSGSPWGYRRKARFGVKYIETSGQALVGFRQVGSHALAEIESCPILHPRLSALINPLRDLIPRLSVRTAIPKIEAATGDQGAALAIRVMQPPSTADERLLCRFGEMFEIGIELQRAGPDSGIALTEPGLLEYRLPDYEVSFRFKPDDFIQVNGELNRLLVNRAVELLDPQPEEHLLDLFCGLGNFTLPLARRSGFVMGIEGSRAMVNRAREGAARNGLSNVRFEAANLYRRAGPTPWGSQQFRQILMDPPRSGAADILNYLPETGAERILYISCLPESLAFDARRLTQEYGYRLAAAGVIDMFPHTAHVEAMALFER